MGRQLRQGLVAGVLVALLFVIDGGLGNSHSTVAHWFALDSKEGGKVVGFFLLLLLGSVFGLHFRVVAGRLRLKLGRWLLTGPVVGVVCWLLVALHLGTSLNHVRLTFGGFLCSFILQLVYGLLLGSIAWQWSGQQQ
ncbi:MAG: hypothetical protein NVSMB27_29210 [Ktedonobacteraceae bacterium]